MQAAAYLRARRLLWIEPRLPDRPIPGLLEALVAMALLRRRPVRLADSPREASVHVTQLGAGRIGPASTSTPTPDSCR